MTFPTSPVTQTSVKFGKRFMARQIRHQGELFSLDSPLKQDLGTDRRLMLFNFFGVSEKPSMEPIVYEDEHGRIEVTPSPIGLATMSDKEFLVYCLSLVREQIERGQAPSPTVRFAAWDFFRAIGIGGGGGNYDRIENAIRRLRGTEVKTNIESGGEGEDGYWSWLSEGGIRYSKRPDGTKRAMYIQVTIAPWLFRALTKDLCFLTYCQEYFSLRPLHKRLWEVARARCAFQSRDEVTLEELQKMVGSTGPARRFRSVVREAMEQDLLPGFRLGLFPDPDEKPRFPAAKTLVTIEQVEEAHASLKVLPGNDGPAEMDLFDACEEGEVIEHMIY